MRAFSTSKHYLSSKGLKLSTKLAASQADVWNHVAEAQAKLGASLNAPVHDAVSGSSLELTLEREHGVRNEAELARRAQRLEKEEQRLTKANVKLPVLVRAFQRLTVRSVKFIRWLRVQLFARPQHEPDIATLRHLYATL